MQIANNSPNSVNNKLYGHAYTPNQLFLNDTKPADWSNHHRFGDVAYVRDVDAAGKISPVSHRGYYLGIPSWSRLYKPHTSMKSGHAILTSDNVVMLGGMVRFPNESVIHPRAYQDPGVALSRPNTSIRAADTTADVVDDEAAADDSTGPPTDVVGRDGRVTKQGEAAASSRSNATDRLRSVVAGSSTPVVDPQFAPGSEISEARATNGGSVGDGCTAVGQPSDQAAPTPRPGGGAYGEPSVVLPPAAVIRHLDHAIAFKAGHEKNATKNPAWAAYSKAKTTKEYFDLGGTSSDWAYDIRSGVVWLEDPVLQQQAHARYPQRKSTPVPKSVVGSPPHDIRRFCVGPTYGPTIQHGWSARS